MDFLAIPFGYLLSFCYKLIPNYAGALLIFTLVTKLILFPVGIKQQKNMVKQASLRPKEQALRNRYSGQGNSQKLQEELMKLYQSENYSPYGGCLPMIL
ncbi:MAG: YidC/Oxa1 family membrane protein insertase, partial [Clostridia bacterium]|nr:YidC/Oxa1 family membrane protein insertase [Clostridia bacterium]